MIYTNAPVSSRERQNLEEAKTFGPVGSGFNEEDLVREHNMFTRVELEYPNMVAAGTTRDVTFCIRFWQNDMRFVAQSDLHQ